MSIYQDLILTHYRFPRNYGKLSNPTHTASIYNPLCGDMITMYFVFNNDTVVKVNYISEGCVISKAAASMFSEKIIGKSKKELNNLNPNFMISMLGINLSPNRLKCALLPLEALKKIL